jgi:hypothetical protein
MACTNLGVVLQALVEHRSGTARLDKTVIPYRQEQERVLARELTGLGDDA